MPIHQYSLKFRTLAAASGWNEPSLLTAFRQGLNSRLRLHLAAYDDTYGLEKYIWSPERRRRLSKGLCLYCGASGHMILECPLRPPRALVSTIHRPITKMNPLSTCAQLFFFFFFFGLSVAQITHVSTYAWLYYHHSQPFFFFFLFFF